MGINGGTGIVGSGAALGGSGIHINRGGVAPFVGLLDTYPNAGAAYSVRLLKSDYAGGLVEIAGYTTTPTFVENRAFLPDANNELSLASEDVGLTTTLGDWITDNSITEGYVRTWYDQSGNARNKQQITASIQPQIISGGSLITMSGKPSVQYDNDYFSNISGLEGNAAISSFLVQQSSDLFYVFLSDALAGNNYGYINQTSASATIFSFYGTPSFFVNGTLETPANRTAVNTLTSTGTPILRGEINASTSVWPSFGVFNYFGTTRYVGFTSEMIFYLSDKTADVAGISTEINSYYSIY